MKHKEIYTDFVIFLPDYLISPNCVIRFSTNFTDRNMGIWREGGGGGNPIKGYCN